MHDTLKQTLKMYDVMEHGRTFHPYMSKIKFRAIMSSDEDSAKISHIAKITRTAPQKFMTSFRREVEATEEDLVIQMDKITSKDLVKISTDESAVYADAATIKSKKIAIKIAKG